MATEYNIFLTWIIFTIWFIILLLGIHFIVKRKRWTVSNYIMIIVIAITYFIILYQTLIIIGYVTIKENLDMAEDTTIPNTNTTFKLYNRKDIKNQAIVTDTSYNWKDVLNYGQSLDAIDYNGIGTNNCSKEMVIKLTELVSTRKQQLFDVQKAYDKLVAIDTNLKNNNPDSIFKTDTGSLDTLNANLTTANTGFLTKITSL
jgi:hypothetical protein